MSKFTDYIDNIGRILAALILGPLLLLFMGGILICATPVVLVGGLLIVFGFRVNAEKLGDAMTVAIKKQQEGKEGEH